MPTIPLTARQRAVLQTAQHRVLHCDAQLQQAVAQRTALLTVLYEALGIPEESTVDVERGVISVPEPAAAPGPATP